MRKNLWRDLVARSSILPSAAAVLIGRRGKKVSTHCTRGPLELFAIWL
jgi:hypothetical protein